MDVDGPTSNAWPNINPTLLKRVNTFLASKDSSKFGGRYYTLKAPEAAEAWPLVAANDPDGTRRLGIFTVYSSKLDQRTEHVHAIVRTMEPTTWNVNLTEEQGNFILNIATRSQANTAHICPPRPPSPVVPQPPASFDDLDTADPAQLPDLFLRALQEVRSEYIICQYTLGDSDTLSEPLSSLAHVLPFDDHQALSDLLQGKEVLQRLWRTARPCQGKAPRRRHSSPSP